MIHTTRARKAIPLSPDTLVHVYRTMRLSRRLDEKELQLKRQGRTYFQVSGAGHEAIGVAAGLHLRPGHDWFFPYYRDRTVCLQLGITADEMLLAAVGSRKDTSSGGRQMPNHWSNARLHFVSPSSATGSQVPHAVGSAEATRLLGRLPEAARLIEHASPDAITYVSLGEGATSEGEFWESLNAACLLQLPLLCVVQDNGWAISVPVQYQTPGGSISKLVKNFPGLFVTECDGTDFLESYQEIDSAIEHIQQLRGPALVHAHTVRPFGHSDSDDERSYKSKEVRQEELDRDPLNRWKNYLLEKGIATLENLQIIDDSVEKEIQNAVDKALSAEQPDPSDVLTHIYSPSVDPVTKQFSHQPKLSGDPRTMVDLINVCLQDELELDPRVVLLGQDIADSSQEQTLLNVKGKGGVFKVTAGLQRRFGSARCYNTPIAEATIVGRAIGMAIQGLKPVVEIQFFDYIWPAFMQIRNELAAMRWRSNNGFSCPVVIRAPIGGYLAGGAVYHSQSGECLFTHIPGLRVVMPSTALDANGLLRTAIRSDDPILFLEPKHLYRQTHNRSPNPGPDFMIPFGKGKCIQEGNQLTLITYGSLVHYSIQAAKILAKKGISIEVIDLRSLKPYDWEMIASSIRKTNRALVVHEDCISWGYGAELAARIASELFGHLDAPVKRIGGKDCWVPYHPTLETAILPQVEEIVNRCQELVSH